MARSVDPTSLPKTADGVREAWSILETSWSTTMARAKDLDEAALHAGVDDEWSFVETLRHLVFVTDAWVGRTILCEASPYHRLGLPPDHRVGEPDPAVDVRPWGIDVLAVASFEDVQTARTGRMQTVHDVTEALDDDGLRRTCGHNPAPGFPPSTQVPVQLALDVVIGEEWAHHGFATRDLAAIEPDG